MAGIGACGPCRENAWHVESFNELDACMHERTYTSPEA
ncbi:hypothetical protein PRBEI_2000596600 [Prionailurus iriomotensis]